jgi:hypothetical protein
MQSSSRTGQRQRVQRKVLSTKCSMNQTPASTNMQNSRVSGRFGGDFDRPRPTAGGSGLSPEPTLAAGHARSAITSAILFWRLSGRFARPEAGRPRVLCLWRSGGLCEGVARRPWMAGGMGMDGLAHHSRRARGRRRRSIAGRFLPVWMPASVVVRDTWRSLISEGLLFRLSQA